MATAVDTRALDDLLRLILQPRIGYVLAPWPTMVYRVVRQKARAAALGEREWLERMHVRPVHEHIAHLVSAATVPHTAFFRHPEHFDHLRRTALKQIAAQRGGIVRIWSAGCATGEEPYSLAVCAEQAGVDAQILATDVSAESIAFARAGVYPPRAGVESLPGGDRARGWTAPVSLRNRVRFEVASLVSGDPSCGQGAFDLVLCRNVLIYFDAMSGLRVVQMLLRRIAPHGALVVAPVEGVLRVNWARGPAGTPLGWYVPERGGPPLAHGAAAPSYANGRSSVEVPVGAPPPPPLVPTSPLEVASERLGSGDLEGAEAMLHDLLNVSPSNAEAWFLLGETLFQRTEKAQAYVAFSRAAQCARDSAHSIEADTLMRAAVRRAQMCDE